MFEAFGTIHAQLRTSMVNMFDFPKGFSKVDESAKKVDLVMLRIFESQKRIDICL